MEVETLACSFCLLCNEVVTSCGYLNMIPFERGVSISLNMLNGTHLLEPTNG